MKKNTGITLIALIVTIIILLILAGITLTFMLGDNGILNRAKNAGETYEEQAAREKLEIALADLTANKVTDNGYNENEYIDNKLIAQDMIVNGDIVIVDGWQFEIDRSVPKIKSSLGKGEEEGNTELIVNAPKLENTGLVGVTIGQDGTLQEVSSNSKNWYSYDGITNEWANAKTEDGSLWVWIPRYAYKINADESIDIVFLKGISNQYVEDGKLKEAEENGYIVHPAFRDGRSNGYANGEWREEIEGFWMAKFEAGYQEEDQAVDSNITYNNTNTGNTTPSENYYGSVTSNTKIKYPVFQANRPSINNIGISDAYDISRSLTDRGNPYGLRNIDSHLTKNSEWGAVTYLTQSKYGRNKEEVSINNVSVNGEKTGYSITGYAGNSVSASEVITNLSNIQNGTQEGSWLTEQGMTASTTKNQYGVYDLSGGIWEWTAGYLASGDIYENYGGSVKGESNEYKSKYVGTNQTDTINYQTKPNPSRKGEAIWETSTSGTGTTSWNNDYSYFLSTSGPFLVRGGHWSYNTVAGPFAFSWHAIYYIRIGFRMVLVT